MKTTFADEDNRKNHLFKAWDEHLQTTQLELGRSHFEQIYEGSATVIGFSDYTMGLELEDGRKLRQVPINPQISQHSKRQDLVFVVLGFTRGKWWPLELLSVASLPNGDGGTKKTEIHFSLAPYLIENFSDESWRNKSVLQ